MAMGGLAADQRIDDGGSPVFHHRSAAGTIEILGAPRLRIRFHADKPQALIAVRLNDVAPDGGSTRVTVGLLNLAHRFGHDRPTALVPRRNGPRPWSSLTTSATLFPVGHRMAVSISRPPTGQSLAVAGTRHPYARSCSQADGPARAPRRGQRTPTCAPSARPNARHREPNAPRTASQVKKPAQPQADGASLTTFCRRDGGRVSALDLRCPHAGHRHHYPWKGDVPAHHHTDGDPLSARCETTYSVEIERPDGVFGHESHGALSCDARISSWTCT